MSKLETGIRIFEFKMKGPMVQLRERG